MTLSQTQNYPLASVSEYVGYGGTGLHVQNAGSHAISVGAVNDIDNVASFSNGASFLSLLAPGVAITSALPGGGTGNANGALKPAPHVAGAWEAQRSMIPDLSIDPVTMVFAGGFADDAIDLQEIGDGGS